MPDVPAIALGVNQIREFLMQLWEAGGKLSLPAFQIITVIRDADSCTERMLLKKIQSGG